MSAPTTPKRESRLAPFRGFYRPTGDDASHLDPVTQFLYAARSVILVISAQASAIAGLVAIAHRRFHVVEFVLVLLGLVIAHAISNLSNDYFGYRRGHDTPDSPRLRYTMHPLANGALTAQRLFAGIAVLAAVDAAIVVALIAMRGAGVLWFAIPGALLLYLYDAAPVTLKGIGLGEVASFLVWGPLMVGGGYYAITGRFSWTAIAASIPYGLGVMSILVGKHIDQRGFDESKGQRTLPVVLGERGARRLDQAIVVGMYVAVLALVATGALSVFALVALVAAPRGWRAVRQLGTDRPAEPPPGYVGWPLWWHRACLVHNRLFGWVYLAGLAVGAAFPHVTV